MNNSDVTGFDITRKYGGSKRGYRSKIGLCRLKIPESA
jgi:hypothetical protein